MNIAKKIVLSSFAALAATSSIYAAGFGIYEASARGNVMGGGLVGSTDGDASANYYNPAALTECTNISVMVGVSLINPFADTSVNGKSQLKMNAGWFPPPHAYIAVPITEDLVFGLGTYCEYGLGTKYDDNWAMNWDTTETTIEQFTFNPNFAYKITDKWSVAFGARMSYLTFENYKIPLNQPGGLGYIKTHLEGDNFNCGYMLATQYKVNDDLSLGLVYRSRINHHIKGEINSEKSGPGAVLAPNNGGADAKLTLPSSLTLGANYDITKKFRSGLAMTWTEWSTIDHIDFKLTKNALGQDKSHTMDLGWHDAFRIGFGFEYDFTDAFCGRIGYTYDWDPSHKNHGTTMLPPGDRHIIGFGCGYKFLDNWRIDLGYNFIIMEATTRHMVNKDTGVNYAFETENAYSHIVSASVSYSF